MPGQLSSKTRTPLARLLRKEPSDTERKMWTQLRDRRLGGYKFRRQFAVGPYVTDFCCFEKRLVIELDGSQHTKRHEYDDARTEYLKQHGFHVIRFWNSEVLKNIDDVCQVVLNILDTKAKSSL